MTALLIVPHILLKRAVRHGHNTPVRKTEEASKRTDTPPALALKPIVRAKTARTLRLTMLAVRMGMPQIPS